MGNMRKKNICVDFDGVLNTYTGWAGEDELFEMREGCANFLEKLSQNYYISIFTTRKPKAVWKWLKKYKLDKYVNDVTNTKIPAEFYIDDRAITFDGDFRKTFANIENFIPHWKK